LGLNDKQQYHSVTHPTTTVVGMVLLFLIFVFYIGTRFGLGRERREVFWRARLLLKDNVVFIFRREVSHTLKALKSKCDHSRTRASGKPHIYLAFPKHI
jgi:hypothetical protein